jgi:hypothetical protein
LAGGTGSTVGWLDDGGEAEALDVTGVDAGGGVAGGGAGGGADDVAAGCELEEAVAAAGGAGGGTGGVDDDPTSKWTAGSRPPEAEIVSE